MPGYVALFQGVETASSVDCERSPPRLLLVESPLPYEPCKLAPDQTPWCPKAWTLSLASKGKSVGVSGVTVPGISLLCWTVDLVSSL